MAAAKRAVDTVCKLCAHALAGGQLPAQLHMTILHKDKILQN
jgi:hypothetical protein